MKVEIGFRPLKTLNISNKIPSFISHAGTAFVSGPAIEVQDLAGGAIPFSYSAGKPCKSSGKIVHLPNEGPKYRR